MAPGNRSLTIEISGNNTSDRFAVITDPSNGGDANTEAFTVRSYGNVGIGKSNPKHPLDVNGKARATAHIIFSDERLKSVTNA